MKLMGDMLTFNKGNYISVSLYELSVHAQQEATCNKIKSNNQTAIFIWIPNLD